jgi:transposase-like protein
MADPLRQRMVAALSGPPRSVRSLAEEFGMAPHGLYYHVRLLEKYGLVQVVRTRPVSGVQEKLYQTTAHSFSIDPGLLAPGTENARLEAILQYVFTRTAREIRRAAEAGTIEMSARAPEPHALLARAGDHFLTAEEAAEFSRRLIDLLNEFASRDNAEGERRLYGISVAMYPTGG